MKSKAQTINLLANVPIRVYSCALKGLHNVTINSQTNSVYLGDANVINGTGLPLNMNDVINFSSQDFQKVDDIIDIWAVCGTAAVLNLLAWEL